MTTHRGSGGSSGWASSPTVSGWEQVSLLTLGHGVPFVSPTWEASEPTFVPVAYLSLPASFSGWFLTPLLSVLSPSSSCRAFRKTADGHEGHTGHLFARAVPEPSREIISVTF